MFRAFSSHVWSPAGLPATLFASAGAVRAHHQGGDLGRHLAAQRVAGGNEVARDTDRAPERR